MAVGDYLNYGIDHGSVYLRPSSQGSSQSGLSSITLDVNDSTMSVGWSALMITCSVNPSSGGSSSSEPSTYFKLYPKNSSNSYVDIKYCTTANSTHSKSENASASLPQNYARMTWWTSMGHANDNTSGSGERSQMWISCSHMTDGTHITCNVMTPNTSAGREFHTMDAITSSPARYLNFRPSTGSFFQFRAKTYFLGEDV